MRTPDERKEVNFTQYSMEEVLLIMGEQSFLTGASLNSPHSLGESLYLLGNTSIVFVNAIRSVPRDVMRAGRVSQEAMVYLDHIVNEILRERDKLKASKTYSGSPLEAQLEMNGGLISTPVTTAEQLGLAGQGPGNGALPRPGGPLTMGRLLNKIKHRRRDIANFRIGSSGEHYFLITVDKPNHEPDSIVEFVVGEFCKHCTEIASLFK